jgi:Xaa-Pro aminopeptidase
VALVIVPFKREELFYYCIMFIFRQQEDFMGPSFTTISSVGSHAAVVHYEPCTKTDRQISTEEVYLCDSGGQYK